MEKRLFLSTCNVPAAPGSVDSPKELFCCIPAWLKGKENKKQKKGLRALGGGVTLNLFTFLFLFNYKTVFSSPRIYYRREVSHFQKEVL